MLLSMKKLLVLHNVAEVSLLWYALYPLLFAKCPSNHKISFQWCPSYYLAWGCGGCQQVKLISLENSWRTLSFPFAISKFENLVFEVISSLCNKQKAWKKKPFIISTELLSFHALICLPSGSRNENNSILVATRVLLKILVMMKYWMRWLPVEESWS